MKKFMVTALLFASLLVSYDSSALRIFGIEINYERGHTEWNADHTASVCIGKGLCKLTIKASVDAMSYSGQLGNVDGRLVLSIPAAYFDRYAEDIETGFFEVNSEIVVPEEDAAKIQFNQEIVVRPGKYMVAQDDETGNYFVYLTK